MSSLEQNTTDAGSMPLVECRLWAEHFVVKLGLCPFASEVLKADQANFRLVSGSTESVLEALIDECIALDKCLDSPTSLLVIPFGYEQFEQYLDLADLAQQLLTGSGYEGIYQLATFHPAYRFDDTDPDGIENFTNRSPYPILQLLRESAVETVLESFDSPEKIPERNTKLMRRLGLDGVTQVLDDCATRAHGVVSHK